MKDIITLSAREVQRLQALGQVMRYARGRADRVSDEGVVGDTGFEPVTPTVWRKDGRKREPEK
jgi:hypothetical protein